MYIYVGGLRKGRASAASCPHLPSSHSLPSISFFSFLSSRPFPSFSCSVCVCVCLRVKDGDREHRSVMINEAGTATLYSSVTPETDTERTRVVPQTSGGCQPSYGHTEPSHHASLRGPVYCIDTVTEQHSLFLPDEHAHMVTDRHTCVRTHTHTHTHTHTKGHRRGS